MMMSELERWLNKMDVESLIISIKMSLDELKLCNNNPFSNEFEANYIIKEIEETLEELKKVTK